MFFRQKKHTDKKAKVHHVDYDKDLFAALSSMRKAIATKAGLPPFVIFHDRTLIEICIHQPQTKAGLLQINGIGEEKLKRYGDAVLNCLREYQKVHI
ncbi:MAG: HRDC domain-containing protein [Gammaproteobacteria bacterium]